MVSVFDMQRLIHKLLDDAISYGEYVLSRDMMEELAKATDYNLPDRPSNTVITNRAKPEVLIGEITRLEKIVMMQHDLLQGYEIDYSARREQEELLNDIREKVDNFKAAAYLLDIEFE